MSWLRKAGVAAVVFAVLLWTACGDVFRPVAVPIPPPPPDPKNFHFALVVNSNGPFNAGSTTQINVSGDTNVGVATVGRGPVHATLSPGATGRVFVANSLADTISAYSPSNITSVTNINLPSGSAPVFVHTTESGTIYVANSGNDTVAAISTASNVVGNVIQLAAGAQPVALAETPDGKKLYSVNQGNGTVTPINTVDKSVNTPISVGALPVWAATRADSQRAYAVSAGGALTVIDTFSDTVTASIPIAAGANFMLYDKHLNRLYITNPLASTVTIFDVSVDPPNLLATVPVPASPVAVAALADGSRAYVASFQVSSTCTPPATSCLNSQVTVISTLNNTVTHSISLATVAIDTVNPTGCGATRFRLSIAAAADSSRVYVANCDAGGAAILRTFDDTLVLNLPAPVSAFPPPPLPAPQVPPPQNPVFILASP